MTAFGGAAAQMPNDESSLLRRVVDLEREVREMRAARTAEQTAIAAGATFITDTDGVTPVLQFGVLPDNVRGMEIAPGGVLYLIGGKLVQFSDDGSVRTVYAGPSTIPDGSGRTNRIFSLRKDTGELVFAIGDFGTTLGHAHQQAWAFYDSVADVIFADDTLSGHGIARPRIPMGQWVDYTSYPSATTTSTEWAKLQVTQGVEQQPRVKCDFYVRASDGGTSGQVRLTCGDANSGGFVVGDPFAVGAGDYRLATIGPVTLPAFQWQRDQQWFLEAQVVAGSTGSIGVRGLGLIGDGS